MAFEIELEACGLEFEIKGWPGPVGTLGGLLLLGAAVGARELRLPQT